MPPASHADDRPPDLTDRRDELRLPPPFVCPREPAPDSEAPGTVGSPLWLRALIGDEAAARVAAGPVPLGVRLSLVWWRIGLTPTARLRHQRFREAVLDRRGLRFAVQAARRVG